MCGSRVQEFFRASSVLKPFLRVMCFKWAFPRAPTESREGLLTALKHIVLFFVVYPWSLKVVNFQFQFFWKAACDI